MATDLPFDTSLANIWRSWYSFRRGKRKTFELETFSYNLEANLRQLQTDIEQEKYKHGPYRTFIVSDNKKREIRVASIRDRVVHRLLYDYLVLLYDDTFIFDVWSCRANKGLVGAIKRTQIFLAKYNSAFIWRADISKFFDNIDQGVLWEILERKLSDEKALNLLSTVIGSYSRDSDRRTPIREREREREREQTPCGRGMPIGNLTSQVLANVYLNELDRFVKHTIKPKAYLRYGDDFIVIEQQHDWLEKQRVVITNFLKTELGLTVNPKSDLIIKAKQGIHFLGVDIFPTGRRLKMRNWNRALSRLSHNNYSSYSGLIKQHCNEKKSQCFSWRMIDLIE